MPCPLCGHTMHNLGVVNAGKFWCPRCGSIKTVDLHGWEDISFPRWSKMLDEARIAELTVEVADVLDRKRKEVIDNGSQQQDRVDRPHV